MFLNRLFKKPFSWVVRAELSVQRQPHSCEARASVAGMASLCCSTLSLSLPLTLSFLNKNSAYMTVSYYIVAVIPVMSYF